MGAVARARHTVLAPYLKPDHKAIGSINSPMQCMMKEICAQCLQLHKDPVTGEETVVFSCFNQDQSLDHVDWGEPAHAAFAERRAGEADQAMDRPLLAPNRGAAGIGYAVDRSCPISWIPANAGDRAGIWVPLERKKPRSLPFHGFPRF